MKHYLLFCFVVITSYSNAAIITGSVRTTKGDILPFSSILIRQSTVGTTANARGDFSLELPNGTYTLICQYVGYRSAEKTIRVTGDMQIDFELEEQQYDLKEVKVTSGAEDPAYAIIRNAIKNRQKHLEELRRFQCEVYIKGQMKLRGYPKKILGEKVDFEDGDTSKKKMIFLSETVARYSVDGDNRSKIEVLSTRVSGNSDGFGLASPQIVSFYENNISLGNLNPRGFVSPISNNAISFYKYKFEGTYYENGKEINHIKVIPRRNYEPLFNGYIDIIEGEWRIYSVQLQLLKTSQMQYLDTLNINQIYVPANTTWVIKQQVIYPAGKILAFDFHGTFVQVYDKFDLDPKFEKNFFNSTYLKVYDSANKRPSSYWDTLRPIPLLEEEVTDYKKKDSLEQVRKDPRYMDSLDRRSNKPSPGSLLLTGYTYSKRKAKLTVSFAPVLDMVSYNTAEGAVVNFSPDIRRTFEGRRSWFISPTIRYGFSNERWNAHITGTYNFGKKYFNSIDLSFGRRVFQFNNAQPITPRMNTFSTLLWRNNFMKTYEAAFLRIGITKGVGEGVTLNGSIQYQDRSPLNNTTDHSWIKKKTIEYTPNYPYEVVAANIPEHQALVATFGINWQPGAKYIELPDRKINIGSKYPNFALSISQGIDGIAGSDVQFTKWRFAVTDDLDLNLGGRLNYRFGVGGFLDTGKIFVPDYNHYNGNRLSIASQYLNSFQLMSYYGFSNTARFYASGHLEYHLNGLLTNKIPVIKKLNWFIVTGTNTLFIDKNRYHAEVFVGLENILKIFRFDYIYAFEKNMNRQGLRFTLPLLTGSRED